MRLYVTGGTGLVGSNVIKLAEERYGMEVIASLYGPPPEGKVTHTLDSLDMGNQEAIAASLRKYKPDAVIHSAALLDQIMMNRQRKMAWTLMVEGTRTFARVCREIGARLIFVSSDWVFDGREALVDEDSPPHPVNFYGIMKVASERELSVMDGLNFAVGRLAGVYGINFALPSMTRLEQGVGFGDLATYYIARLTKGQPVDVWMNDITPFKEMELKSQFIATVSQDLKQPLSVMSGYIELLTMMSKLEARERHYVDMVQRSIHNMRQLIDDLLDLAIIESGIELDLRTVHINDTAHPTLASDGADLLLRLVRHDATGTFHCFCPESISRLDLAKRVADVFDADHSLIRQVPTDPMVLAEHEGIRFPFRCNASTVKSAQVLGRSALDVVEGLKAFKPEWEAFQHQD